MAWLGTRNEARHRDGGVRATTLGIAAFAIGALAASGYLIALCLTLAVPFLLGLSRSRKTAFALMFCYYAGATWQILPGAAVFFGHHANSIQVILLWVGASTALALPWALFFSTSTRIRLFTVPLTLIVLVIPPLGVVGVASPLIAAGILFPGMAWFGLLLTLLVSGLLASYPRWALVLAIGIALPTNLVYHAPAQPKDWEPVSTHFEGVGLDMASPLAEYSAAQFIQQAALNSKARVIVFPETVVSNWNEATDAFWSRTIQTLQRDGETMLVGAVVPDRVSHHSFNSVVIRGADGPSEFLQRIPIPISMWNPFSADGIPLRLQGQSTLDLAGEKAAILICYEQLLVWPELTSFVQHPTILVGIANDYWARGTIISKIQHASLASWARLFRVPLLWAENS
jgi:hypothetical protein